MPLHAPQIAVHYGQRIKLISTSIRAPLLRILLLLLFLLLWTGTAWGPKAATPSVLRCHHTNPKRGPGRDVTPYFTYPFSEFTLTFTLGAKLREYLTIQT